MQSAGGFVIESILLFDKVVVASMVHLMICWDSLQCSA